MNNQKLDEIIGWYGTIAIVLAYGLLSFGVFNPTSLIYQILNGTGAIGIVYISFKKKVYQSVTLNLIWTVIAIIAIIKILI